MNAGTVTVRTYSHIREIVGRKELRVQISPSPTVGTLLEQLSTTYGIDLAAVEVMVNGKHVNHLNGEATLLNDGDLVTVATDPPRD